MVLERIWRSTWTHRLRELRDALGGHHGEKIWFSPPPPPPPPPPPCSLAGGSRWGVYGDRGMAEMDLAMSVGGGGVGRYQGVYRHHLITRNTRTVSFPACGPTHSCRASLDSPPLCGSSPAGTPSHPLTISSNAPRARSVVSHEYPSDAMRALPFHHTVIVWT